MLLRNNFQIRTFSIDSHDYVLRFNHAPTSGFEADVGSVTSARFLNGRLPRFVTQVQSPVWDFFANPFAQFWEDFFSHPSSVTLLTAPEFLSKPPYVKDTINRGFSRLIQAMGKKAEDYHIFSQHLALQLWDVLQGYSPEAINGKAATAGFVGKPRFFFSVLKGRLFMFTLKFQV